MHVLERSGELGVLGAAARSAARGHGAVALVYGEAGIGKSTVIKILRSALPAEARLLVGYCDALSTPRTLGPFKDVAPSLGREVQAALASGDQDPVMTAVQAALDGGVPTVLVIEDVHWADEATLDVLRYLARRIEDTPAVLVFTYRDELERGHPLVALLGDLGQRSDIVRLQLRPLSAEGVTTLATEAGGPLGPDAVFELKGGNPYLVTELLASASGGLAPDTVVEGILGRLRLLPEPTRAALEQLSVLPGATGKKIVDALLPGAWDRLDEAEARGLITVGHGTGARSFVMFRHELTRRAVADGLSGTRRIALNRAALLVFEGQEDADLSQLVHHALEAGDEDAVVRNAPAAAREASGSGSHRESARHYGAALEFEKRFDRRTRAQLWQDYAIELYTIGDDKGCVPAQQKAVMLRREVVEQDGDRASLAVALRWLSRLCWFAGEPADARRAATEATRVAYAADDETVLALALSNESQLAMLAEDNDRSVVLARKAIELARKNGDQEVLSHALTNLGSALFHLGDRDHAAQVALEEAIDVAMRVDDHEDACRAYVNLSWSLLDFGDIAAAESFARAGVVHAERAEFLVFWQYLLGILGRIELGRARWDNALACLERIRMSVPAAWCVSLGVRAAVAARRGQEDPTPYISQGWELATRLDEFQRTVPIACIALEAAWLAGTEPLVDGLPVYVRMRESDNDVLSDELAYRLRAIGRGAGVLPAPRDNPYGLMSQRRWREASGEWARLGWPYQQAEALAASPDIDDRLTALGMLDDLGAVALATRVRRQLRELGVSVGRGPSSDARSDPSGLTARQRAVLALIAEGLTNAQIADRLVVSVRTVDSHVAAVFAKLGVASRGEAAAVFRRTRAEGHPASTSVTGPRN